MLWPVVAVDIDGKPVGGLFFSRLISLTVTDREGIQSDTLDMKFDDSAPHFSSPRRGAIATVNIIVGGRNFSGRYVIDKVEFSCLPHTIKVTGHSADLRSEMKTKKSRHWDNKSVRQIVTEIAGDYGLEARIADAVSDHVYVWIGQQDESDLNFLERLARRHNALFTIKDGKLLWLERGAGKTAEGTAIPTAIIIRTDIELGSCRATETDVDRYKTIKAFYQDRAGAKRQEVVVDGDPDAEGEHVIRDPFSSQAEARKAAEAFAKEMLRGAHTTSCTVVGRPDLMAGQPVAFLGVRPGLDGVEYIVGTVKHTYSKANGVLTSFDGKLKL